MDSHSKLPSYHKDEMEEKTKDLEPTLISQMRHELMMMGAELKKTKDVTDKLLSEIEDLKNEKNVLDGRSQQAEEMIDRLLEVIKEIRHG